jgi:hypothetical protein
VIKRYTPQPIGKIMTKSKPAPKKKKESNLQVGRRVVRDLNAQTKKDKRKKSK